MKILIALATCLALASALDRDLDVYWKVFKQRHQKKYGDQEEPLRREIWERNLQFINRHNIEADLGRYTYRVGMNEHGDLSDKEYLGMLGARVSNRTRDLPEFMRLANVNIPEKMDWRDQGVVTPVKNQGRCGSCWAFAATGSLESQVAIKTKRLISLSEQNLVDCSHRNHGCEGGNYDLAWLYIKANKGVDLEQDYPYMAEDGPCRFRRSAVGATDTGAMVVRQRDPEALKEVIATVGPVAVAFDASAQSFRFYRSGVYTSETCSKTRLDHAVLAVGYGVNPGAMSKTPYWLVKNSWGTTWGNEGYFKIRRGTNECGIEDIPSFPTI